MYSTRIVQLHIHKGKQKFASQKGEMMISGQSECWKKHSHTMNIVLFM